MNGAIAQSVERSLCKQEVQRSKLCGSIFTIKGPGRNKEDLNQLASNLNNCIPTNVNAVC